MTNYGIAVIGAGMVVDQRHLPGLAKTGLGEARSVFDPHKERASAMAEKFDIPANASTLEQAIDRDEIDAVLIASPNAYHREAAECAFVAGKHVFCEKPIATTLEDARAICDAAERSGRLLHLGFHHRFNAEHLCVKRLLDEGVLGDVRAFHSVVSEPIEVVPYGTDNYRFDFKAGGGLTLVDVGSHRIDQTRALLGEVAEVHARMDSVLDSHSLDDSAVLSLKMQSGAACTLAFHRFSRAYVGSATMLGTKATVAYSSNIVNPAQAAPVAVYIDETPEKALPADLLKWTRPQKWWGDSPAGWVELWPPRIDTFEAQWREFFEAIEHGRPARVSGEDGYRGLEIVLAAYQSVNEGRPIGLPLDAQTIVPAPDFRQ